MSEQVQISDHANLILTTSSSTLRDTSTHMEAIGATIRSGGKLITKYGRRETTDKILLALALLLYFGVIVYILKKRVFTFRFPELW
ncbi:Vesicle transport protein SEC20 [Aphelenchoides fujianensis]|nr:Vesicle transport protein SEC20 [Aphelenchoides fujianensis]